MGEPIADDRLTGIVIEGLTDDYDRVKYDAERDPDLTISDIEVTLRNMYSNRVARNILGNNPSESHDDAFFRYDGKKSGIHTCKPWYTSPVVIREETYSRL